MKNKLTLLVTMAHEPDVAWAIHPQNFVPMLETALNAAMDHVIQGEHGRPRVLILDCPRVVIVPKALPKNIFQIEA